MPHRESLEERLKGDGLAVAAAHERGQYVSADAAATLSKIMVDGSLDPGRFVEVHIALLHLRTAGKDLLNDLPPAEIHIFLNAEIRYREIHVALGCMVYRVDVSRAVPGAPHTVCFRQTGDLQAWSYASDVVKPDSDEIDQPVRYQAGPFHRMAE